MAVGDRSTVMIFEDLTVDPDNSRGWELSGLLVEVPVGNIEPVKEDRVEGKVITYQGFSS